MEKLVRIDQKIDSDIFGPNNLDGSISFGFDSNIEHALVTFENEGVVTQLHVTSSSFARFCDAFLVEYRKAAGID